MTMQLDKLHIPQEQESLELQLIHSQLSRPVQQFNSINQSSLSSVIQVSKVN